MYSMAQLWFEGRGKGDSHGRYTVPYISALSIPF